MSWDMSGRRNKPMSTYEKSLLFDQIRGLKLPAQKGVGSKNARYNHCL